MLGCVIVSKPSFAVQTVGWGMIFDFSFTGNKDIYVAESVQANNSSKNQVHCCSKW